MATHVEVIRNFPRTELLREGYSKTRLASSVRPAAQFGALMIEAAHEEDIWVEPNTGVIMLRPSALLADFWENSDFIPRRMPITEWDVSDNGGGQPVFKDVNSLSMLSARPDLSTSVVGLTASIAALTIALSAIPSADMKWVKFSKNPLAPNEGFTVIVHPPGLYTERAQDYLMINFGHRYILSVNLNGTMKLYSNAGDDTTANWVQRAQFTYAQGGVTHGKPFQLTVIPWGFGYITFLVSQSNEPERNAHVGVNSKASTTFLYDMNKVEGPGTAYWDPDTQQYIKTPSYKLGVACRSIYVQYGLAWARVCYPNAASVQVMPEHLPQVLSQADPALTLYGFQGQIAPDSSYPTQVITYTNSDGTAWDKTADTELAIKVDMTPSTDGVYTPEFWEYKVYIPELLHTPDWTPYTQNNWTKIEFDLSTDSDVNSIRVKTVGDSLDVLLNGWGPLRVNFDSIPVFDGYVTQYLPTIKSWPSKNLTGRGYVEAQIEGRDMWLRLNEKTIADFAFLDGRTVLEVIREAIYMAGFASADIDVDSSATYLDDIQFEGFLDPNDQKGVAPDATVGDLLRSIIKTLGSLAPLRIRWSGGVWRVYFQPAWDASAPAVVFRTVSEMAADDATRWASGLYYVLGDLQFKVEEPKFNGLLARSSQGTTDGADGNQAIIPAALADPRSLTDPTYYGFIGREKIKVVAPPEITMAQSSDELVKFARGYWEREHWVQPTCETVGEWTSDIDVDIFIWLQGYDTAGSPVSYGVYRIEHISVEAQLDWAANDKRWSHQGNYNLVYVGMYETVDWPAFSVYIP